MIQFADLTDFAQEPNPALQGLDLGQDIENWIQNGTGAEIFRVLTSRFGTAILAGAISSAPGRPPHTAIEPWIAHFDGAFEDTAKRYTGRLIRKIVEHLGGHRGAEGIPVEEDSNYTTASIYFFEWPANMR